MFHCNDFPTAARAAAILLIWVLFLLVHMVLEYGGKAMAGEGVSFGQILSMCLDLVIGIEFTKMLCRHTPDTILDVLMFATARQAILDHSRIVENLLAVLAIAILFAIKRYILNEGPSPRCLPAKKKLAKEQAQSLSSERQRQEATL